MGASKTLLDYAPAPRELAQGKEWNVFLSYRSVNRRWVIHLYDVLRSVGHNVFLDQCVLKGGDQLARKLEDGLQASQAGVLVWSHEASDSDWVRREYETMERMADGDFAFIPVRLDDEDLPMFAQNCIFLDFTSYPDGPNGGELLRLLYSVVGEPFTADATDFAERLDEATHQAANQINAAIAAGDHQRLVQLFNDGGLAWDLAATLGCIAANGLIGIDRLDEALKLTEILIDKFPSTIRPKQLSALALARKGGDENLRAAQVLLGELYADGQRDPETLGIYARTFMDRYAASDNKEVLMLRRSRDLYAEAFEGAKDDYYTGINAAAKSVFLGNRDDIEQAGRIAADVQEIVGTEIVRGDYWQSATAAEIQLVQKNYERAGRLYADAVAIAPTETGNHKSTWLQAQRLMEALGPDEADRKRIADAFAHLGREN